MKVFSQKFLETPSADTIGTDEWSWEPVNSDVKEIYASGASTNTNQSTYAAEKDDRSDSDRPNEGLIFAA